MRYDDYRIEGLPKLVWGPKVTSNVLECPECSSHNVFYSGTSADPEEVLGEAVRCGDCGWLTDYYEMYKQVQIMRRGGVGENESTC